MKKDLLFIYRVKHPEYGEIEVTAKDRLHAACEAGKAWGVGWTSIARGCAYEKTGPAPEGETKKEPPRRRPAGKGSVKK